MGLRVFTGFMILTSAVVLAPVAMISAADVPPHTHPPHYKTCMALLNGNEALWRNFRTAVPPTADLNYCAELSARYGGTHARLGCRECDRSVDGFSEPHGGSGVTRGRARHQG